MRVGYEKIGWRRMALILFSLDGYSLADYSSSKDGYFRLINLLRLSRTSFIVLLALAL